MIRQIEECQEVKAEDYDESVEEISYVMEEMINKIEEHDGVEGVYYCNDPANPEDHIYFSNHEEYQDIQRIEELVYDLGAVHMGDGPAAEPREDSIAAAVGAEPDFQLDTTDSDKNESNHDLGADLKHGALVLNGDESHRLTFHVSIVDEFGDAFVIYFLLTVLLCTLFTVYYNTRIKPLLQSSASNRKTFWNGNYLPPQPKDYSCLRLYYR